MQTINVRNLFIAACVLKVASALAGWHFSSPWVLGFGFPLAVMVIYMWLGITRKNDEVSDEKFADSCYYLGFIFTIASISVALMDLPNIGLHIQDIAVRFGAAMLSTVLGLSVRVAMVTFRKDLGDAIHNAEEGVVEASIRFSDQLGMSLDRLRSFETAIDEASRVSVERVNLQVDNLSRNHAEKLAQFFAALTKGNQEAFTLALEEVKGASMRLSKSVDGYALGMRSNLASIDAKIAAFSDAITDRLKTTTFPDDYFAKHLDHPLGQLKSATETVHDHILGASETVGESTAILAAALKKLRAKASATESALDSVTKLAAQQQLLMDTAQVQVDKLDQLGTTLQSLDGVLVRVVQEFEASNRNGMELKETLHSVVADSEAGRKAVHGQLKEVAEELRTAADEQLQRFEQVQRALQAAAESYVAVAARVESTTEAATGKLLEGASANLDAAGRLAASAAAAENATSKLESVAAMQEQLNSIMRSTNETNSWSRGTATRRQDPHIAHAIPIAPEPAQSAFGFLKRRKPVMEQPTRSQVEPTNSTYRFPQVEPATDLIAENQDAGSYPVQEGTVLLRQPPARL